MRMTENKNLLIYLKNFCIKNNKNYEDACNALHKLDLNKVDLNVTEYIAEAFFCLYFNIKNLSKLNTDLNKTILKKAIAILKTSNPKTEKITVNLFFPSKN